MLQGLIEIIVENGLQAIGWFVLKVLTFGRYTGFEPKDAMREGAVGLAIVLAAGYGLYRWVW
jgi:hypothetical protein